MTDHQVDQVQMLLDRAREWAARRSDVRALAVVGSWARGDASPNSDVDLVLVVDTPDVYLLSESWTKELGASSILRTKSWGAVTERRLALPLGLELDVGIAPRSWAATAPVDAGSARVVREGIQILVDPDDLLAKLSAAIEREGRS